MQTMGKSYAAVAASPAQSAVADELEGLTQWKGLSPWERRSLKRLQVDANMASEGGGKGSGGGGETGGAQGKGGEGGQGRCVGEREYRSGGQGGGGEHRGGGAAAEGGRLGHVTQEEKETATITRFMFAQFVLRESKAKEFFHLMERTPAAFVMVLCDSARPGIWHPRFISELLQKQGDVWGAECFEQGALLYKKWRVSAVAECDSGPLEDDKNLAFSFFKVFLRGDDFNPRDTVIAVACVWLKEKGAAGPWGSTLLGHMKERIVGDEVRFLCGLMIGVPREQVEELGRSCGATSTCPLHQTWTKSIAGRGQEPITHTAYIIPFGLGAKRKFPVPAHRTPMPIWLQGSDWEIGNRDLPCFSLSPRSPSDLGVFDQKEVDLTRWVEGIHQLILWVSATRRA